MFVATIPNRGSPSVILLRESYREDGKVKTRTLATPLWWADTTLPEILDFGGG